MQNLTGIKNIYRLALVDNSYLVKYASFFLRRYTQVTSLSKSTTPNKVL